MLLSEVNPDFQTDEYVIRGDSSLHSRGVSLVQIPHGSDYLNAGVSIPGWMTDQVIQRCMEALSDLRANILEDFGQARQTLGLMVEIFNLITDLFMIAWKRDWKRLRRLMPHTPKRAASGWLMYYYGVLPLVGTLIALSDSYAAKRKTQTVVRKVSISVDPLGFVAKAVTNMIQAAGKAEQGAKCGLTVAIDMSADLSMKNSLGLANPWTDAVVTAWALTPYSFVVDWILPVERFLRTRSWQSGLAYQSGYVDRRLTCDASFTAFNAFSGTNDRGTLPKARLKAVQLQRTAYNSFSPPSGLNMRLHLTSTQTVNALALALQRM